MRVFTMALSLVRIVCFGLWLLPAVAVPLSLAAGEGHWAPASGVTFIRPLWIGQIPGDTQHLIIAEQGGRVVRIADHPTATAASVILDLTEPTRTDPKGYSEEGLLSLAFHPDFAKNGWVFAWWMPDGGQRRTELARFLAATAAPFAIDPASRRTVLSIDQPFANHNGGDLHFGADGMLYLGLGDGGSGGDPKNAAQDLGNLLGKIIRIDVSAGDAGRLYRVPANNPFVTTAGARPEIWAYGLRNPWRMRFAPDGRLWVGDVGQNTVEEIDVVSKGGNYGWRGMEGFRVFKAGEQQPEMIEPVLDYPRRLGMSVTGGVVYAGAALPTLRGRYIFGDFATGRVWSIPGDSLPGAKPELRDEARTDAQISTFGVDAAGEVLIADYRRGRILRLLP